MHGVLLIGGSCLALRAMVLTLTQLRGFALDFAEGKIIFPFETVPGLWITAENPV
jgi:hypothetical protein